MGSGEADSKSLLISPCGLSVLLKCLERLNRCNERLNTRYQEFIHCHQKRVFLRFIDLYDGVMSAPDQIVTSLGTHQKVSHFTGVFPPQAVVFPPARVPEKAEPLLGQIVKLRPLTEADFPTLYQAIAHPEVFATGWGGGIANYRADFSGWKEFMQGFLPSEDPSNIYGVCLRDDNDRIVGTTSLSDLNLKHGSACIGWTAYSPEVWGKGVNADTKYLLLNTLFEHGFERIRIQADSQNRQSIEAIERLGASYEGTHRHTRRRGDGSWSDSAVYSILSAEWPAIKERLEVRIQKHSFA